MRIVRLAPLIFLIGSGKERMWHSTSVAANVDNSLDAFTEEMSMRSLYPIAARRTNTERFPCCARMLVVERPSSAEISQHPVRRGGCCASGILAEVAAGRAVCRCGTGRRGRKFASIQNHMCGEYEQRFLIPIHSFSKQDNPTLAALRRFADNRRSDEKSTNVCGWP